MNCSIDNFIGLYDIGVLYTCEKINSGLDKTFKICSSKGNFILKVFNNKLNNGEYEPDILKILKQSNLPVSEIIRNKLDAYISEINGNKFHVQKYIDGTPCENHSIHQNLLSDSAMYLAKINFALSIMYLPDSKVCNLNFDDCKYYKIKENHLMIIDKIKAKLQNSKEYSKILDYLNYRLDIIKNNYKVLSYGIESLSLKNSHGDYSFRQILLKNEKIAGIIDFSRASKIPVSWELIRSYTISSIECKDSTINFNNFKKYLESYERICLLTKFDKIYMPNIYILQLLSSMFGLIEYIDYGNVAFLNLFYWRTDLIKFLIDNRANFYN